MQLPTRISKINNIEVTQLGESSITVENKSQENKKVGKRKLKKPRIKKKKHIKKPPKNPILPKRTKELEQGGPHPPLVSHTTEKYEEKLKNGKTTCSSPKIIGYNYGTNKRETWVGECL